MRPGFLTLEYLRGKRVSYIPPLRLFIFSSIIFFLLLSVLNLEEVQVEVGQSQEDYFWDRFFESFLPKLFFLTLTSIFVALGTFLSEKWEFA